MGAGRYLPFGTWHHNHESRERIGVVMTLTAVCRNSRSLTGALLLTALFHTAATAQEIPFTISNPASVPVTTVARVSLPVPAGVLDRRASCRERV